MSDPTRPLTAATYCLRCGVLSAPPRVFTCSECGADGIAGVFLLPCPLGADAAVSGMCADPAHWPGRLDHVRFLEG